MLKSIAAVSGQLLVRAFLLHHHIKRASILTRPSSFSETRGRERHSLIPAQTVVISFKEPDRKRRIFFLRLCEALILTKVFVGRV